MEHALIMVKVGKEDTPCFPKGVHSHFLLVSTGQSRSPKQPEVNRTRMYSSPRVEPWQDVKERRTFEQII